jgi:hypothetical protein
LNFWCIISKIGKEYEAGEEDFEKYDDLMEWEFAKEGKEYWQAKLKEKKEFL